MSDEANILGVPHFIQLGDKSYPISLITARVRMEWERKMLARSRDKLTSLLRTKKITRKEYTAELMELERREERGEFGLMTKGSLQAINGAAWAQKLLLSLLMPQVDSATLDLILEEKGEEVFWLLEKIFKDSIPQTISKAKKAKEEETKDPFEAETPSEPSATD